MNPRIPRIKAVIIFTVIAMALAIIASVLFFWSAPLAAQTPTATAGQQLHAGDLAFIAAALATGLSSLAASYAVASVGAAAIGAMAEKPELFGRLLIVIGLAEGIAIYGLIISIMILTRLG